MIDIITAAINFFATVIVTEKGFIITSFSIVFVQSLLMYALFVSHSNKNIALTRKELGMNEVDQVVNNIFKILNSHFLTLAKDMFEEDYFNKKETAIYRYLIKIALDERKPVYRHRIRKNHFNEKSPAEWTKYVKDCIEDDIEYVTRYLDDHYHPQAKIPRPTLYEWNKSKIPEIERELNDLFCGLLTIAENNKLKRFFGIKLDFRGI